MKAKRKHGIRRMLMCVVPVIIALILTSFFRGYITSICESAFFEIVKIVIDLEGTMLGFIITAVSILVAFNGSNLTEEVKKTGHFKTVLLVYLVTCFELFVSITYCVCILIGNIYSTLTSSIFTILLITASIYIVLCLFFLSLVVYTLFK